MPQPSHHLQPGHILRSRYRIVKPLSSGAFGDTYVAIDDDLPDNPQVVVKYLKLADIPDEHKDSILRLFQKEAVSLRNLGEGTSQIPKLWANFTENGDYYLVQEFIDGAPLSDELTPGTVLSEIAVMAMLREILTPLKIVHDNQIIHRDLKPDNIIRRRSNGELVLIDFGAVKEIGQMKTQIVSGSASTIGIGTPGYMPDEQRAGHPRYSSDIHAVGIIAIQALTGFPGGVMSQFPVNGDTLELDWLSQVKQPISTEFAAFLTKMVKRWYDSRFPDASAALMALEAIGWHPTPSPVSRNIQPPVTPPSPPRQSSTPQPPVTPPSPSSPYPRRNFLKWVGFGGVGVVGALVLSQWGKNAFFQETAAPPTLRSIQFASVKLDSSGKEVGKPQGKAEVFDESLGNGVNLTMVKIPAGKFLMGSPASEGDRESNESPQHEVSIPEFYMGQTEVTQAQWQAIMWWNNPNPSQFKGDGKLPVDSVSWLEAMEFCKKLNEKTGRRYTLPSEAQWEYACRAGTTTPFAYGETITAAVVNYNGDYPYGNAPKGKYRQGTTPVGSFPPNLFGLYDMHGNVWEWCLDEWVGNYNGAPTDGSARGDINSRAEKNRLLRGGSWDYNARYCRSAYRGIIGAWSGSSNVGFRLVWVQPRTP
jgi:eukaryotic-like serine/threonine-protein kinase